METDQIARIDLEIADNQSQMIVDRPALEALVGRTLDAQGVDRASISLAIVDNPTIRTLNARHLGHDWPTDVISFLLSDPDDPELAGELIVSAEMAMTMARLVEAEPSAELALYVVHGLLHLCGYDDIEPEDAAEMRAREAEILALAGVSNPFPLVDTSREELPWSM